MLARVSFLADIPQTMYMKYIILFLFDSNFIIIYNHNDEEEQKT